MLKVRQNTILERMRKKFAKNIDVKQLINKSINTIGKNIAFSAHQFKDVPLYRMR